MLDRLRAAGPREGAALVLERLGGGGIAARLRRGRNDPAPRFASDDLARWLRALLSSWGMADSDAAVTVEHVLYSDLHGIDSHGCAMFGHYHRAWRAGTLATDAVVSIVRDGPTTALVDGGGGLGHVPADRAMRLAIEKCRRTGLGAVAVRGSGHFGAAGSYALLAAREGLLGLVTSDTATPAVVPTRGLAAMLGTNPLAVAAPAASGRPFLLDMATSTVPVGRLATAWRRGAAIPAGWACDRAGRPLRDARRAFEARRLTPLGGTPEMSSHKGYGLATAVALLSTVLPGAGTAREPGRVGHFFLALAPDAFGEPGAFPAEVEALLERLRATPPLDPSRPVLVAGDPERAAAEERRRSGIPLAPAVVAELRAVAAACGVPFTPEPLA